MAEEFYNFTKRDYNYLRWLVYGYDFNCFTFCGMTENQHIQLRVKDVVENVSRVPEELRNEDVMRFGYHGNIFFLVTKSEHFFFAQNLKYKAGWKVYHVEGRNEETNPNYERFFKHRSILNAYKYAFSSQHAPYYEEQH